MPVIERYRTIARPREEVWRWVADVPRQPLWMRDLKSIAFESPDEPVAVGSRATGTVRMFGLTQSDPIEISFFDPPRRYGVRHLGHFAGAGDIWLTPIGSAWTRVRWREELRPSLDAFGLPAPLTRLLAPLVRLMDPLLYPVFALVFRADLRRLKRLVEGEAVGSREGA